jgi:hypothetical protein
MCGLAAHQAVRSGVVAVTHVGHKSALLVENTQEHKLLSCVSRNTHLMEHTDIEREVAVPFQSEMEYFEASMRMTQNKHL